MTKTDKQLAGIFHLKPYEVKLYRAALVYDQASLTILARRAKISRTAAYIPLQSLVDKSLVTKVKVNKRYQYQATQPGDLVKLFDRKKVDLEALTSKLSRSVNIAQKDLAVTYYPGIEGIWLAGDILLEEAHSKLWKTFEDPLKALKATSVPQADDFNKKRVAKGVFGRMIMPADKKDHPWIEERLKHNKEELRDVVMVSPRVYPMDATIVTDGKSTLMYDTDEPAFALLIRNESLSRTLSSVHDLIWDRFRGK